LASVGGQILGKQTGSNLQPLAPLYLTRLWRRSHHPQVRRSSRLPGND
jgi:hypothetical protein